jgi:rRNA small subunit pseudouridine methyltransferase Nep1
VVVFLVRAGLYLGQDGLVDAYDRGYTTAEVANESVRDARPDIVHQCLLALFDSDLGASGRLRVYITTTRGKTIKISPQLRPPRTFDRFKGLMTALLRDGRVEATPGPDQGPLHSGEREPLMQVMYGSAAPALPFGAEVIGVTNLQHAKMATSTAVARFISANPVPDTLQGGVKNVAGFFCIDCTEEADASHELSVTKIVSLSPYPLASHVQCLRLCEGLGRVRAEAAAAKTAGAPSQVVLA